ncbi:MAG: divalent metal cation transporter [Methylacidiphilales bacterium]|nr:divalent metal cation transporter [Candidatus Methylacidiphilales bacterium]
MNTVFKINNPQTEALASPPISPWKLALIVFGPGLVVMLADTDAGSAIVAAQSGAQWGYRLLLLQLVLIPILFMVQELTVRLGLTTRKGHGELIAEHFGKGWAWLSVGTLLVSCVGAMLTEFSGIAGVGLLFGVSPWISIGLTVVFLVVVVATGSYRQVEVLAILLGLFELAFVAVAFVSHPSGKAMLQGMAQMPLGDRQYLFLLASNMGAVIMPWMIFYQQSAVVDKGLDISHLKPARWDTAIGAVITQSIMVAILVLAATTIGAKNPNASLDTVQQIADALIPFLGPFWGKMIFALGILGAALVATIVVSLTAAWGLGEVAGYKRSLAHHPFEAPWFYGIYVLSLLIGAGIVLSGVNLIKLAIDVNVMNALLLPIVLGFLFLLARKALPEPWRLKGWYAWLLGVIVLLTAGLGVYAGIMGIWQ